MGALHGAWFMICCMFLQFAFKMRHLTCRSLKLVLGFVSTNKRVTCFSQLETLTSFTSVPPQPIKPRMLHLPKKATSSLPPPPCHTIPHYPSYYTQPTSGTSLSKPRWCGSGVPDVVLARWHWPRGRDPPWRRRRTTHDQRPRRLQGLAKWKSTSSHVSSWIIFPWGLGHWEGMDLKCLSINIFGLCDCWLQKICICRQNLVEVFGCLPLCWVYLQNDGNG